MDAYTVEVDRKGCPHCGHSTLWAVVGPDGMQESVLFEDEDDADVLARRLNSAYEKGRAAGRKAAKRNKPC
jgi:hypothetical protein